MRLRSMSMMRLVGIAVSAAYFFHYLATYRDWHFIDNVNLIFHEAGHTILLQLIFGEFLHVLGGSLFQILIPFICATYFLLRQQSFSGSLLLMWMGQSIINVSLYAGDSVVQALPLLGGDNVGHDWFYLLSRTGMLIHTDTIANVLFLIGATLIVVSTVVSARFVFKEETL